MRAAWDAIVASLPSAPGLNDIEILKSSVRREHGVYSFALAVDRPAGVDTTFCELVSRYIAQKFDATPSPVPPYQIEVASAGLERPLLTREHFARFAGREAKVVTMMPVANRTVFTGPIASSDQSVVRLDDRYAGLTAIPYAVIKRATLVYEPVEDLRRSKRR